MTTLWRAERRGKSKPPRYLVTHPSFGLKRQFGLPLPASSSSSTQMSLCSPSLFPFIPPTFCLIYLPISLLLHLPLYVFAVSSCPLIYSCPPFCLTCHSLFQLLLLLRSRFPPLAWWPSPPAVSHLSSNLSCFFLASLFFQFANSFLPPAPHPLLPNISYFIPFTLLLNCAALPLALFPWLRTFSPHPFSHSHNPLCRRRLPSPTSLCTLLPGEHGRATTLAFRCRASWPTIGRSHSSSKNVLTTLSAQVSRAFFFFPPRSSLCPCARLLFLLCPWTVRLVWWCRLKLCCCSLWKLLPCLQVSTWPGGKVVVEGL